MEEKSETSAVSESVARASVEELLEASAVPGLGPVTIRRLLGRFGSWGEIKNAKVAELLQSNVGEKTARAIAARAFKYEPAEQIKKAAEAGVTLVPFGSPNFPRSLRDHDEMPLLLYVMGEILERDALAVGIVGSRRSSLYGRMHAERFAFALAQADFTIVSGLAQGVDAAAHDGALRGRGRTISVLGSGLDRIYPPENAELAERIAKEGAVVSELPMGTPPSAENFPPWNRIIAGLSLGVLVVEAAKKSGALITARLAGELGKEVFALPGDIGRPQTYGCHKLIRDGAKLVQCVEDIIEEFGPLTAPLNVREGESPIPDPRALLLNGQERKIYDMLDSSPRDIDEITRDSGFSSACVASTLMVLELKRLAVQLPGKLFARSGTIQRE